MNIEGELTIYRAAELRGVLLAALASSVQEGGDLEIDLAGVTEFDSAGVQLLLAAQNSARQSQRALRLKNASPAVREVFETLDLAAHFAEARA
ncbi:MAG: STAS domain-containing protein [Rubrivivax sp.]